MRGNRAARRLVVDDRTYIWSLRHKHRDGDVCRDVLQLILDGVRTRIVFRTGEGRGISGCYALDGFVATGPGRALNLNEPGTVRRLVDEATARGLLPHGGELDGWDLFDAVLSRAAAATPEAPPGSPPGP
ncbi:hypothetical protein OHT57_17915 [Streptomyces sp. NBC_00285]|uniref:hypothetical protein n=1 Tax=Streptomyces sp. NBC_00285 TaxID=2975700 RepID=UPI002E2D5175|nr:hypothetical protein [Streptomyces sp. NBC_00285]